MKLDHIELEKIETHHDSLEKVSNLTEEQIKEIFKNHGDKEVTMEYLEEIYNKQYVPGLPVWCTMIFIFRNDQSPSRLYYGGCDPCNQCTFRRYFCKNYDEDNYFGQILGFFAWIKNSWNKFMLAPLFEISIDDDSFQIWESNEIKYFFQLTDKHKKILIDRYNSDVVDEYNKIIKN